MEPPCCNALFMTGRCNRSISDAQGVIWTIDGDKALANDRIVFAPGNAPTFALCFEIPPVPETPVLMAWEQPSFRPLGSGEFRANLIEGHNVDGNDFDHANRGPICFDNNPVIANPAHGNAIDFELHGLVAGSPFQALYRQCADAIDEVMSILWRMFVNFRKGKGVVARALIDVEGLASSFPKASISGLS